MPKSHCVPPRQAWQNGCFSPFLPTPPLTMGGSGRGEQGIAWHGLPRQPLLGSFWEQSREERQTALSFCCPSGKYASLSAQVQGKGFGGEKFNSQSQVIMCLFERTVLSSHSIWEEGGQGFHSKPEINLHLLFKGLFPPRHPPCGSLGIGGEKKAAEIREEKVVCLLNKFILEER